MHDVPVIQLLRVLHFNNIVKLLICDISVVSWINFSDFEHDFPQPVVAVQDLQKFILADRRKHKLFSVGIRFTKVAHRVLQTRIMVYLFAVYIIV